MPGAGGTGRRAYAGLPAPGTGAPGDPTMAAGMAGHPAPGTGASALAPADAEQARGVCLPALVAQTGALAEVDPFDLVDRSR